MNLVYLKLPPLGPPCSRLQGFIDGEHGNTLLAMLRVCQQSHHLFNATKGRKHCFIILNFSSSTATIIIIVCDVSDLICRVFYCDNITIINFRGELLCNPSSVCLCGKGCTKCHARSSRFYSCCVYHQLAFRVTMFLRCTYRCQFKRLLVKNSSRFRISFQNPERYFTVTHRIIPSIL